MHNEIVGNLLEAKSKIFDIQNPNNDKINIKNIIKEDEIFVIKNDLSIYDVIFNYSYRKVIINDDYSEFNKYEINLEYIEEMLTDELLKNKKLISDDIFIFTYKNEDLEFKNKDICTKFKNKISEEELSINDKIIFYEYFNQNKGVVKLHLRLLDDFANLIIYSTENIDKIQELSKTKICKLQDDLDFISNDFKELFKEKDNLNIYKILNIYEYYQILCFEKVKQELKNCQEEITDEEQKKSIKNYIENNLKTNKNIENILETAIRKFILCFLSKIDNKENIKLNQNNINNYFEIEDLWNKNFYKTNEFYQELKKLKELGIKIKNVIPFYEKCFNNFYKNYFNDEKTEIRKREEERIKEKKEKEKEDIRNFNFKDNDIEDDSKTIEENKNDDSLNNDKNNNENNGNENENNNDDDDYIDEGENEDEEYGGRY